MKLWCRIVDHVPGHFFGFCEAIISNEMEEYKLPHKVYVYRCKRCSEIYGSLTELRVKGIFRLTDSMAGE